MTSFLKPIASISLGIFLLQGLFLPVAVWGEAGNDINTLFQTAERQANEAKDAGETARGLIESAKLAAATALKIPRIDELNFQMDLSKFPTATLQQLSTSLTTQLEQIKLHTTRYNQLLGGFENTLSQLEDLIDASSPRDVRERYFRFDQEVHEQILNASPGTGDASLARLLERVNIQLTQAKAAEAQQQEAPKDNEKEAVSVPYAGTLNNLSVGSPEEFVGGLIKAAMGVMGTIALAVLVYAGVLWMTAAGNSDRQRKALDIMFWGALGVLVIFSSYAIVQFIVENAFVP